MAHQLALSSKTHKTFFFCRIGLADRGAQPKSTSFRKNIGLGLSATCWCLAQPQQRDTEAQGIGTLSLITKVKETEPKWRLAQQAGLSA